MHCLKNDNRLDYISKKLHKTVFRVKFWRIKCLEERKLK
jgi:hypothetical protein